MSSLRRIIPLISRLPNGVQPILQPISILTNPSRTTTTTTSSPKSIPNRTLSTETKPKKSSKSKKSTTNTNDTPTTLTHHQQIKQTAKLHRTNLYNTKIANQTLSKSSNRRTRTKKTFLQTQFRTWYDPYCANQQYLAREANRQGLGWKHKVSVMIERLPVVTLDEEKWEEEWEVLRGEMDRWGKVWPKELGFGDPMDSVMLTKEQIMDMMPEGFTPMPRETPADHSGFLQTLDRKLKTRVYLSIRPNDTDGWMFPTMDLRVPSSSSASAAAASSKQEETIGACARRVVLDMCGEELDVTYISNCPMGVTMESNEELGITKEEDSEFFGVKTWFMRVQYSSGSLDEKRLGETVGDWGWLDRGEMAERVKEEKGEKVGSFYHYML